MANQIKADLIMLASHGRGGFARAVLGSDVLGADDVAAAFGAAAVSGVPATIPFSRAELTAAKRAGEMLVLRVPLAAAGVPLTIEDFDAVSRRTPIIADLKPAGRYVAVDVHRAGGIQLIAKRLAEGVERLALTIGQQPETQGRSEPLHGSLERLRERTAEAAKLIGEA